mgnify:CR=1 FL=1
MTIAAGVSGQNSTASGTTITTTISAPSVGDFMVAVATATATVGTLSIDGSGWTEHTNQTVAEMGGHLTYSTCSLKFTGLTGTAEVP